jgi:head-tail adaptor
LTATKEFLVLLNNTFRLYRNERTQDGQGGFTKSPEPVLSFMGRLRPATVKEQISGAEWQAHVTHVLYAEASLPVTRHDQVEGAGKNLRVVGVRDPSNMGHHLEIDCEEIQHGD